MKKVLLYSMNTIAIIVCAYVMLTIQYFWVKILELVLVSGNAVVMGMNISRDLDYPLYVKLQRTIKKLCDENYNLARENEELKGLNK